MQEGCEPFGCLEAHEVIAQHRAHEPLVIRQRNEQPRCRPGDVQEKADTVFDAAGAQTLSQGDQVVVMHPDEVVFLDHRRDAFGEPFVDPLVSLGGFLFVLSQIEPVVEQRPQRRIRIAVVIFVDVLLREVHRRGRHAFERLFGHFAGERLDILARPAEPDAAVFLQRRVERACQSALRSRRAPRLRHGNPVRDNKQSAQRTSLHGFDSNPAQLITPTSE